MTSFLVGHRFDRRTHIEVRHGAEPAPSAANDNLIKFEFSAQADVTLEHQAPVHSDPDP